MQNFLSGILLAITFCALAYTYDRNSETRASNEATRARLEAAQVSQAKAEAACITLTQVIEHGLPRTPRMTP